MIKTLTLLVLITLNTSILLAQTHVYIGDSGLNNVRKIDLEGNVVAFIDDDINTPRGIKVDFENKMVFYVNGSNDSSIRAYNEETKEVIRIISDLNSPSRLALNTAEKIIYFTERNNNSISQINYDGSNLQFIASIPAINEIDFDPVEKKIYYVHAGATTIFKMNADGSNREVVAGNLDIVHSLNLDSENKKIYYSELGTTNTISVRDYDGRNIELLIQDENRPVYANIDCDSQRFYYATIDDNTVHYKSFDGLEEGTIPVATSNFLGAIALEQEFNCKTDAIQSISEVNELNIFPNPVFSDLNFQSKDQKINHVAVYNMLGQSVLTARFNSVSDTKVNFEHLKPGSYLLSVNYANGLSEQLKIIKL